VPRNGYRRAARLLQTKPDLGGADARTGGRHLRSSGVPAELLFDQMKAVTIEDHREIDGRLLELFSMMVAI
jgi:hypothetical protein